MKAFGLTDVGLKRTGNQDAFYLNNQKKLYIVADGMGGHKAGDTASRTAIDAITSFFAAHPLDHENADEEQEDKLLAEEERRCNDAVVHANHVVHNMSRETTQFHGMGTTLVMLKIVHGHAVVSHVGDSRVYRIVDEKIELLTKDHSRIQELIDQNKISAEEAKSYPLKNVITRALGGAAEVKVDTAVFPLGRTDVFLMCTDGLSGVLSDSDILEIVSSNPGDPEESCQRLVQLTLDRGAPDNVTVIVGDTRAYSGLEPNCDPEDNLPENCDEKGAFRKFIDKWFRGS